MGSVVGESLSRVTLSLEPRARLDADAMPLNANELRTLARAIIDKEPSEIRNLLRNEPEVVVGWVSQLKTQQLQSAGSVDVWHDALDHIRLSTLSPLKFAAE